MRLYRLTTATLFQWKSWVICLFAVGVLPFVLPQISSATENGTLLKPAIAQATWAMALLSAIFWGFFTAAKLGENNARSGVGEYFLTSASVGRVHPRHQPGRSRRAEHVDHHQSPIRTALPSCDRAARSLGDVGRFPLW
jgi:hypothetical protein